jgi:hypothetical protein
VPRPPALVLNGGHAVHTAACAPLNEPAVQAVHKRQSASSGIWGGGPLCCPAYASTVRQTDCRCLVCTLCAPNACGGVSQRIVFAWHHRKTLTGAEEGGALAAQSKAGCAHTGRGASVASAARRARRARGRPLRTVRARRTDCPSRRVPWICQWMSVTSRQRGARYGSDRGAWPCAYWGT